ncbi:lipoprotein insertase outer membrane protein LolB [Neisseria animalis]|uniref:Outer-membrane lipoprotein LolB n=1 Tax=Neisseria animalis TaxID=492 RepID=A0A5P3MT82_NEIAN|nr:lipoprotein insertase outer membrane protein LolB [Neisseria animalis]QEY24670.1 outer membrane lipoprotein LolB [Neisseria animalis]ROW31464.1 outer membrane lipoprotein LolB [Neisseria animalis]VEE07603.1 outer membrane lipoprotein [Neisseria animalis]
MKFKLPIMLVTLLLAACTTTGLPQQGGWPAADDVGSFTAAGRLAVKVEEKGSYAHFDWTYQNKVQTINVNTPLGTTVGQLCQDAQGVLAVDGKGRIYQADTAEELSTLLLGFELPVQHLYIWADGKRVAGAPYQLLADGRLQQFGWTINRSVTEENKPRVLQLANDKLSVRLVFDEVDMQPPYSAQNSCAART